MDGYKLCVAPTSDGHYTEEWANLLFGEEHLALMEVVMGPDGTMLYFRTQGGLYYAMGYLDRHCIRYSITYDEDYEDWLPVPRAKRVAKGKETEYKIYLAPLDPESNYLRSTLMWQRMNLQNDLWTVHVKFQGNYAFLSYLTYQSMWYTIGYFVDDNYLIVRPKDDMFIKNKNKLANRVDDLSSQMAEAII